MMPTVVMDDRLAGLYIYIFFAFFLPLISFTFATMAIKMSLSEALAWKWSEMATPLCLLDDEESEHL